MCSVFEMVVKLHTRVIETSETLSFGRKCTQSKTLALRESDVVGTSAVIALLAPIQGMLHHSRAMPPVKLSPSTNELHVSMRT